MPPALEDLARWHTSPFEPGSKWYDAFYGGPVDGDLFDFDAATVATAIDWLDRGPARAVVPVRRARCSRIRPSPWSVGGTSSTTACRCRRRCRRPSTGKPGFYRELHERYGLDRMTPDDWAEIRRTYYAMVSRVDDQLGQVRDALDARGAGRAGR